VQLAAIAIDTLPELPEVVPERVRLSPNQVIYNSQQGSVKTLRTAALLSAKFSGEKQLLRIFGPELIRINEVILTALNELIQMFQNVILTPPHYQVIHETEMLFLCRNSQSFHLHTRGGVSRFTTQAMSCTGSFRTFIVHGP